MPYVPTVWKTNDTITADLMNKVENGVKEIEDSIPVAPSLATSSKDGLLSKSDFSKLEKITGELELKNLDESSELAVVITAINEINSVLKTSGLAK